MILLSPWSTLAVRAQEPGQPAVTENKAALFDQLRRQAFDAFYNLDYSTSSQLFQQIMELVPEHPAGYLYMATQVWVGQLNRTRRLQTGIYSSSSFYSKSPEKVDPEVDRQFQEYVQKAIEKAQARLHQNERDVDARYFLGAAYAILAAYQGTAAREFYAALKNGSRAVSEHRKVVEQDPQFADAYLTIGIYDYIVGSLPLWVKVIAALGGIRGSQERGIEELRRVVEQGKYASDDARVLLIAIYAREGDNQKALALINELVNRYPRNYYFPIEAANLLLNMGRRQDGFNAFEAMLQQEPFRDVYDLVHFQYAQSLSANGYNVAALHHYRHVINLPHASPQLVSLAHLQVGRLLDLRGEREAAIAEYKTVLNQDNVFDSHEQAEQYLKKPFTGSE
jgi:tetratricopeptide (TPR) repeat protein